jgi:hypothetical protein
MDWLILVLVLAVLAFLATRRKRPKFELEFTEITNMPTPTENQLHVNSTYDVAGGATGLPDGVTLSNLAIVSSGPAVVVETDPDSTDNNQRITTGTTEGDTASLTASADGSDGKRYEAAANVTLVAKEVEIGEFQLVFTEVA